MSAHEQIMEYIQRCRDYYPRKNVTEKLLSQGYTMAEIEAAWEAKDRQSLASMDPLEPVRGIYRIAVGIIFLIVIGGGLLFFNLIALGFGPFGSAPEFPLIGHFFILTELATILCVGVMLFRGMSYTKAIAILLTVNFLWFVVIFGTCLAPVGR